jgi:hypothetical protein
LHPFRIVLRLLDYIPIIPDLILLLIGKNHAIMDGLHSHAHKNHRSTREHSIIFHDWFTGKIEGDFLTINEEIASPRRSLPPPFFFLSGALSLSKKLRSEMNDQQKILMDDPAGARAGQTSGPRQDGDTGSAEWGYKCLTPVAAFARMHSTTTKSPLTLA